MLNETELRKLFQACYRLSIHDVKEAGIKRGFKKAVQQNTYANYNACKKSPELRKHVLSKYGRD